MPSLVEEPLSKPDQHRKSPRSQSKLVSTVLGLVLHQTKVSPAAGLLSEPVPEISRTGPEDSPEEATRKVAQLLAHRNLPGAPPRMASVDGGPVEGPQQTGRIGDIMSLVHVQLP